MKTVADIFVAEVGGSNDFSIVAPRLCVALGVEQLHERESSNYTSGSYFKCTKDNVSFTVATAGEAEFSQYPLWIRVESAAQEATAVAHAEASALSKIGWLCFVPTGNWARKDWVHNGATYGAQQGVQADVHEKP